MTARDDMLARIRAHPRPALPLPALAGPFIEFADRERQFLEVLTFVGGRGLIVEDVSQLEAAVQALPCLAGAGKVICTVAGLPPGNCDPSAVSDPHELADLDVAILPGEFAVAENAAVWVTDRQLRQRAAYFLTQHLVLVVSRTEIVDHLHQAYERLRFDGPGYGLFISGPSKTADIEQSLVIGAHGPRSLTVLLVG